MADSEDALDGMDPESAALIAQLQLEDIRASITYTAPGFDEAARADGELALQTYQSEVEEVGVLPPSAHPRVLHTNHDSTVRAEREHATSAHLSIN